MIDRSKYEIMFVIGSLAIGGAQRHLADIAHALSLRHWRIAVYVLIDDGPILDELLGNKEITVIQAPFLGPQASWSRIRRVLRLIIAASHLFKTLVARRSQIVHFMLPASYLVGAPLAFVALSPIRIMSRLSLNRYQLSDWKYRVFEPIIHKTMTAILGNSCRVVRELGESEGVSIGQLGLIYMGINIKPSENLLDRSTIRKRIGIPSNSLLLVVVANLIPYKGHLDLLNALETAKAQLPPDWKLIFVGQDYGIKEKLQNFANSFGMKKNVVFLGARSDVSDILSVCDIGILPSHEEGFSIALLEKMAASLALVVTDVGGNGEAIVNNVCGLVVPPHDITALADAIVRLAFNPKLRDQFGSAAKERVKNRFSLDLTVEAYDILYQGLIDGKKINEIILMGPTSS